METILQNNPFQFVAANPPPGARALYGLGSFEPSIVRNSQYPYIGCTPHPGKSFKRIGNRCEKGAALQELHSI
jgi:hypothetical protein